jgi:hypothetical protein
MMPVSDWFTGSSVGGSVKKVYVASNPADAHLVKGVLEGENIEVIVQGEFLWGARGEIPVAPETAPSVWVVDDADYERAVEVLSDLASGTDESSRDGSEWVCDACGETSEAQFTECWQCGKDRPA